MPIASMSTPNRMDVPAAKWSKSVNTYMPPWGHGGYKHKITSVRNVKAHGRMAGAILCITVRVSVASYCLYKVSAKSSGLKEQWAMFRLIFKLKLLNYSAAISKSNFLQK